ncbi:TonB-dependent receptor plug domain-containing protein [Hirschia litorea]|uniref:TonB-dependent receptor plug domain-containing protein n=1 Tax=Hirschia litorea TaxID=1199156 RepID=A0ABW2IJA8_9PROT
MFKKSIGALGVLTFGYMSSGANPAMALDVSAATQESSEIDLHLDHDEEGHDDAHAHEDGKQDTIIVEATRLGRRVQDEPMRVEVINREEIEEKAIMRPGNISMIVAETGGVRVQTTSPALGSANIRMQGMAGRYTQLLADGLPLYGGQTASIGLLQIPPTDLRQVEVIKGSASSLYGGSALGGVVNLVSRRPNEVAEGEVLFNATTQNGQDLTAYYSTPLSEGFGASITAGAHRQSEQDLDSDGWIDLSGYERFTARPRVFWEGANGANVYWTAGAMKEERQGGNIAGRMVADGSVFQQNQNSMRFDSGLIAEIPLNDGINANFRASGMVQDHEHLFGDLREDDTHESYLVEASVSGTLGNTGWIAGLANQTDVFRSDIFPDFDYSYEVPGLFAQIDQDVFDDLSFSASGRIDEHSEYGTQFSPRVSVLYRPGDWTIRGSVGQGFFAPTPFVEAIEAAGLSRLDPLSNLQEETAKTASLDIGYRMGAAEANINMFASDVENSVQLEEYASTNTGVNDRVRLVNAEGMSRIRGSEFLLRYYLGDFKVTGSYLYLDATEIDVSSGVRKEIELTPKHSAGFVAMWEQHDRGRVGFEAYYTGKQKLEGNPYLSESKPYVHLGLLAEAIFGRVSVFINAENLLDVKQTDEHPLVLPNRAADGQWTTDIWSRNDGFILNGGIRLKFGG